MFAFVTVKTALRVRRILFLFTGHALISTGSNSSHRGHVTLSSRTPSANLRQSKISVCALGGARGIRYTFDDVFQQFVFLDRHLVAFDGLIVKIL